MSGNKITPCYFGVTDKEGVYQVSFELTNLCNLECSHCFNQSSNKSHIGMEKSQIFKLIDELAENNVTSIYMTGGEPTNYPGFVELIEYIKSKKIELILASNGYDIESYIGHIKKNISLEVGVFVSIDGIDKTHDEFRNKEGAFNRTVNSIKMLRDNGIPTRISTVVWKKNIDQLEDLVKLAKSLKAYQIHFTVLVNSGRAKQNDLELDSEIYPEVNRRIEELKTKYSDTNLAVTSRRNTHLNSECEDCMAGIKIMHINCKGEISPCSWIAKSPLNDKYSMAWEEGSLKKCISKISEFKELLEKRKDIHGYTGCPALAAISYDDELAEDPLNKMLDGKFI